MDQQTAERILGSVRIMGVESMFEVQGTSKLARILGGETDRPYPDEAMSGRCDIVLPDHGDGEDWIECKFSWTYMTDEEPAGRNESYSKHLFGEGQHSALDDLRVKLPSLIGKPGIGGIGFLLVSFDSILLPMPDQDVEDLEQAAGLFDGTWSRVLSQPWTNPRNADCHIRSTFWWRSARSPVRSSSAV